MMLLGRILLGVALAFALGAATAGDLLLVTEPTEGQVVLFDAGGVLQQDTSTVRWYCADEVGGQMVNVTLLLEERFVHTLAVNVPCKSEELIWKPGVTPLPQGSKYQVVIETDDPIYKPTLSDKLFGPAKKPVISGTSAVFSIMPSSFDISFISPKQGDVYLQGQWATLQWSTSDVTGAMQLSIELHSADGLVTIVDPLTANDGHYSWKVDELLQESGAYYTVRLSQYDDANIYWDSPEFAIVGRTKSLSVVAPGSPDATAIWFSTMEIEWRSTGYITAVDVVVRAAASRAATTEDIVIGSGVHNFVGGALLWEVPSLPPGEYVIRVFDATGTSDQADVLVYATSSVFTLVQQALASQSVTGSGAAGGDSKKDQLQPAQIFLTVTLSVVGCLLISACGALVFLRRRHARECKKLWLALNTPEINGDGYGEGCGAPTPGPRFDVELQELNHRVGSGGGSTAMSSARSVISRLSPGLRSSSPARKYMVADDRLVPQGTWTTMDQEWKQQYAFSVPADEVLSQGTPGPLSQGWSENLMNFEIRSAKSFMYNTPR
jgi:hypothetical protein